MNLTVSQAITTGMPLVMAITMILSILTFSTRSLNGLMIPIQLIICAVLLLGNPSFSYWVVAILLTLTSKIGGLVLDRPLSNVFYIDTLRPQQGWTPGPSLNYARYSPYCLVFNDEIWALGGWPRDLSKYGESLQPFSGKGWSPMDTGLDDHVNDNYNENFDPYYAPTNITIEGHAILSNKLFMYGYPMGALHCYDTEARKWTLNEENFGAWRNTCASIGEMMYLVEGDTFKGYDLINHQWYVGFGLEECKHLPPTVEQTNRGLFSTLVHIGNGTLCLLWSSFMGEDYTDINCTKFGVSKEYNDNMGCFIIQATVKSFKVYRVPEGFLKGAVAVDAGGVSDD